MDEKLQRGRFEDLFALREDVFFRGCETDRRNKSVHRLERLWMPARRAREETLIQNPNTAMLHFLRRFICLYLLFETDTRKNELHAFTLPLFAHRTRRLEWGFVQNSFVHHLTGLLCLTEWNGQNNLVSCIKVTSDHQRPHHCVILCILLPM